MDVSQTAPTPHRRRLVLWIGLAAVLAVVVLRIQIGTDTSTWGSEMSLSAPNAEGEKRVFRSNDVVFLLLDDRRLTRDFAERAAASLREKAPWLETQSHMVAESPYSPAGEEPMAELIVLVETRDHESYWLPIRAHDDVTLHLAIGRTPRHCMDVQDSPLHGLRGEFEVEGTVNFWGLSTPGGQRDGLVEKILERWDDMLTDLEFERASAGAEPAPRAETEGPVTPPLELVGTTRAIYAGHRADGSFEAMWQTAVSGSHTRAIEDFVVAAEADGWTNAGGHNSSEGRPIGVSLRKDGDELQVLPAHFESSIRPDPDAPDVLALVLRRDP